MKSKPYVFCILLILTRQSLWAQQPPHDPLDENLFPPELVMQHQQAIGLSDEQKKSVIMEIQTAQMRFTEVQFQLQSEMETMVSLVKQNRVDEQAVLAQLDKIIELEREIKRTHLSLVIRIKNKLTPEQQDQLQEIKTKLQQK